MGFVRAAFMKRGVDSVKVGAFYAVCLVLAACGGGGGGGDSAPGSGGSLVITPTSFNFVAQTNGALPLPQSLTGTFSETNVGQIVAGYPIGTIPPTWLNLTIPSNSSPFTVTVAPSTTALSAGTYSATVLVGTGTSNGTVISIRSASVTYQVGSVTIAPSSVVLASTAGVPTASGPISVSSSKGTAGWSLSSFNYTGPATGWLHPSFNSPNLPASMTLNVDPLPAGNYSATFDISDGTFLATMSVTYNVSP